MAEEQSAAETTVVQTPSQETVESKTGGKRAREEETVRPETKKTKVDEKEVRKTGPVDVGYKKFDASVEMFDYFYKLLHYWPPNLNVNKYEHTMLLDLLKKGHLEAEKKMGTGINAFQVRYHPQWKSRCFFLVRVDGSADDFSFRKCVDHILPLPENMAVKSDVNKALGGGHTGGGRGGGRGNWRGRGRGGKPRN
ncbi:putative protein DCL [Helianthus debilis subsp. tardiflorus]